MTKVTVTDSVSGNNNEVKEGVEYVIAGTISDNTKFDVQGTLTIKKGAALGSVTFSNGTGDALNEVMISGTVTSDYTITKGSIIIEGNVTGSNVNITVNDGIAKVIATIGKGVTITVADGATLEIPAGTTIENGAVIDNTAGGKVIVAPGINTVGIVGGFTYSEESFGMNQDLESDLTVKNAYLQSDLVIPDGVTLTVGGKLDLNGKNLTVYGTLVVEKRGSIITSFASGNIVLGKTGVIDNSGTVGTENPVTISDESKIGSVTMKGVNGIEFGLTKEIRDDKVVYVLTVSGEISKNGSVQNLSIEDAYITGTFEVKDVTNVSIDDTVITKGSTVTIGTKAIVSMTDVKLVASTMDVDGKLSGNIHMTTGSTVAVSGQSTTTFDAFYGKFNTYKGNSKADAEKTLSDVASIGSSDGKVTGYTIKVVSSVKIEKEVSKTTQTVYIEGALSYTEVAGTQNLDGTIAIDGKVTVPAGSALILSKGMSMTGGAEITVKGSIEKVATGITGVSLIASEYTITTKDSYNNDVETFYYTTFDNAYAAIADADDMTITIHGNLTFKGTYTIAADQTVQVADENKDYKVDKDSVITVEADAEFVEDFVKYNATNPDKIKYAGIAGLLIVKNGGDCTPVAGMYEVKKVNSETGDITYSGAELAIANAVAGDVIDIVGHVIFEDAATIPAGVTVKVADGASITAEEGLTVEGKLVNKGTVSIASDYDLIVTGEVENKGTITLGEKSGELDASQMTVTGKVVSSGTITGEIINAASYVNEDLDTVYTTVSGATTASAAMDIPAPVTVIGKVTEASDVVLAEGITLYINGEVVLDSIRLVAGSYLTVTNTTTPATVIGTLTADVIAAVGTEETTGALSDAVVDVSKYKGTANNGSTWTVVYDASKATYTMNVPAYKFGEVIIEAGSVNYTGGNISDFDATSQTDKKTLKVADGATFVVEKNVTFTDASQKAFINNGTIQSKDDIAFTSALVGGNIIVEAGKKVTFESSGSGVNLVPAIIAGTVTLSEKDGKVATATISGEVLIGSTPETLGATGSLVGEINATAGHVIVFEGSTFQDTTENSTVKSTAYIINDIAFATVYGNGNIDVIDNYVVALDDLAITTNYVNWFADDVQIAGNDGTNSIIAPAIGTYETVSTSIKYAVVDVIVSVGPGLIVYIDDVVPTLTNGIGKFDIGTHTVTVYLQKGYEGTPAITFNGQTVTDGKLVLTSDMLDKENKLVVTGATVMQDQPVVIQPSDSEKDGMELTDILLIVLVVLIVIMAIIV
ncbi:MAG: hypothetical protein IJV90_02420, partial [Candidatus Methanomethylophilaceae archaeon]|nr:hypothetical protein [Candidatus Methanomethylophilaceae archaeon]